MCVCTCACVLFLYFFCPICVLFISFLKREKEEEFGWVGSGENLRGFRKEKKIRSKYTLKKKTTSKKIVMKWRKRKLYSPLVGVHIGEATTEINVKVLQEAKNKITT